MIRTLRRKFIAIAMLSLLGTLTVLCGAIAAGNAYITADRADRAIDLLYQNSGEFPSPPEARPDPSGAPEFQVTPETPFETRYFIVELTDRREVQTVDTDHIAALDRQTVVECVNDILADGGSRGYVEYYRFGVFEDQGGGSTVIVLDCFLQLQSAYNMLRVTLLVALACAGIVFLLLAFFSRRAIRPFAENLERQRQFVTDASHELKTPLAILSADLGMLEEALPEDRWLRSAQGQVTRLDKLIRNLVELARTEEAVKHETVTAFSLSDAAEAGAEAFTPLAEAAGKALIPEITPGVEVEGVQDDLFRLLSILLDNGVKYCDPRRDHRALPVPAGKKRLPSGVQSLRGPGSQTAAALLRPLLPGGLLPGQEHRRLRHRVVHSKGHRGPAPRPDHRPVRGRRHHLPRDAAPGGETMSAVMGAGKERTAAAGSCRRCSGPCGRPQGRFAAKV